MQPLNRKLCVAPMMSHTDRHFRFLLRLISRHVMLYTEMVTTGALLHGEPDRRLSYDNAEHPVGIQLGGSEPSELASCARLAEDAGYKEINLNVGCPSDRVKTGRFGACLMAEPQLVGHCVVAMQNCVDVPVTVKTRIGIDDLDSYEYLSRFINTVEQSGCKTFIIHARKAWLSGLSPRQNREIPPLKYDTVYQIKKDYPHLEIIINGGITSLEQTLLHNQHVDGSMIGRAVCHNPYLLALADERVFNDTCAVPSRQQILLLYMQYIEKELNKGTRLSNMTRHILGIFQGKRGARAYRRHLSENVHRSDSGIEVIEQAMELVKAA